MDLAVAGGLALEEDVDEAALQVGPVRAVGQLEPGVLDGLPDAVGVERIAHDRVPDPVPATDPAGVADDDDLGLVELDT